MSGPARATRRIGAPFAGLIARGRLGTRPEAAGDLASEAAAEMLHGILQVEFDRAHVDTEAPCDLAVRQLFEMRREEDLAPALGQFGKGFFEFLELVAGLD